MGRVWFIYRPRVLRFVGRKMALRLQRADQLERMQRTGEGGLCREREMKGLPGQGDLPTGIREIHAATPPPPPPAAALLPSEEPCAVQQAEGLAPGGLDVAGGEMMPPPDAHARPPLTVDPFPGEVWFPRLAPHGEPLRCRDKADGTPEKGLPCKKNCLDRIRQEPELCRHIYTKAREFQEVVDNWNKRAGGARKKKKRKKDKEDQLGMPEAEPSRNPCCVPTLRIIAHEVDLNAPQFQWNRPVRTHDDAKDQLSGFERWAFAQMDKFQMCRSAQLKMMNRSRQWFYHIPREEKEQAERTAVPPRNRVQLMIGPGQDSYSSERDAGSRSADVPSIEDLIDSRCCGERQKCLLLDSQDTAFYRRWWVRFSDAKGRTAQNEVLLRFLWHEGEGRRSRWCYKAAQLIFDVPEARLRALVGLVGEHRFIEDIPWQGRFV